MGDEVLGLVTATPPLHDGSYAQVISGASNLVLAQKPAGLSFELAEAQQALAAFMARTRGKLVITVN